MLKKIKRLLSNNNSIEIRPTFDNASIGISLHDNGKEVSWESLSASEKARYSKILNDKYSKDRIPLDSFNPRVKPKRTIEEYTFVVDSSYLLDALKDWEDCPESHPAIEEWYKGGCPTIALPKSQEDKDFEMYYSIFTEAKDLEDTNPLEALNKYIYILDNFKPTGTSYYMDPAYLFCKLCRYDEAVFCIGRAKENSISFGNRQWEAADKEFHLMLDSIDQQKDIFNKVLNAVKEDPGIVQSDFYKKENMDGNKARFVISNMYNYGFINRVKYKNSYRLYLENKADSKKPIIGF